MLVSRKFIIDDICKLEPQGDQTHKEGVLFKAAQLPIGPGEEKGFVFGELKKRLQFGIESLCMINEETEQGGKRCINARVRAGPLKGILFGKRGCFSLAFV